MNKCKISSIMTTGFLKNLSKGIALAMVIALGSSMSSAKASVRSYYQITDLGTLNPININDEGTVLAGSDSGLVTWHKGRVTHLSSASFSSVIDFNNKGQIVGEGSVSGEPEQPVLWEKGKTTSLGVLPSTYIPHAVKAMNNVGQIVGWRALACTNCIQCNYCALWTTFLWKNGSTINLNPLGGDYYSEPHDINDQGQVVGLSKTNVTVQVPHAVLWQKDGQITALGSLSGGSSQGYSMDDSSQANGINNKGQVVGGSRTSSNEYHAFLWHGKMSDLGTLPGNNYSEAHHINNWGTIVGRASTGSGSEDYHAVIWRNGKIKDLNDLLPANSGWVLQDATTINNRGQIRALGTHNGHQNSSCILTPVWVTQ